MKIYVLGNPLVKKDSLPLKLMPRLQKIFPQINFIIIDPNEDFPPQEERDLIILDTVLGIKKPTILDLNAFEAKKKTPVSPHDYDLLLHLLLLKKTGRLNNVKIIGMPSGSQIEPTLILTVNLINQL